MKVFFRCLDFQAFNRLDSHRDRILFDNVEQDYFPDTGNTGDTIELISLPVLKNPSGTKLF